MLSGSTIYIQHITRITEDTILLPAKLFKKFKIEAHFISIVVGTLQYFVKVIPSTKTTKLGIHPILADKLCLTPAILHAIPLHYKFDQKQAVFQLGPILSVLLNPIKDGDMFPFGNTTQFALELSEVAKQKGILLYFVTPDEMVFSEQTLEGWIYTDQWSKRRLPFPNVVYNRIANRKIDRSDLVQRFLGALDRQSIPYFNSRHFNKDEVFKALEQEQDIAVTSVLPQSQLLTHSSQVNEMLKNHRTIYIKPINGRLGRGIYRIHRLQEVAKYKVEQASQPLSKAKYFSTSERLLAYLKPKLSKQSYQIQQGVALIHTNSKPIDFRVLVQKNGKGQWTVTSIVARTAADDIFVSNLSKGGSIDSISTILPNTSLANMYTDVTLKQELKRVALLLAYAFENNFDAFLGELGIDLALDESGKVWLLEINGKPSKQNKAKPQKLKIRPSVKMLISYVLFLSGFKESERSK